MRILILSHYYPPELGAPQTRLHETAVGLQALGHHVTVLTGPPHYPTGVTRPGYSPWQVRREVLGGVSVVRVPVLVRPNRGLVDRSIDQLSFSATAAVAKGVVERSDVVVVDSPPLFLGLTASLYRAVYRRPYLFHVADPWPDYPIQMGALQNPFLIRMARSIEALAYRHAALITTVSPGLVQRLSANPEARGKVRLLRNGVDLSRFQPTRSPVDARAELGWPEASLTLVYAGSVGLAQGLDTLIEAVAPLADSGIVVRVVGEGFDRDRLAREVTTQGLDHIRFVDAVKPDSVPTVLAAADAILVLLRPGSLNQHAMPTKLVEGLAAGRPLVVSADGDAEEVVSHARAGVTAPAGDAAALRRAIDQLPRGGERTEMGLRARGLAEAAFDRRQTVRALSDHLEEIVDGGVPSTRPSR
jgi:glycosyltransferase involved in cell wall biosynthesis